MSPSVSERVAPLGIRIGLACIAVLPFSSSFLSAQDFYVDGRTGADTPGNGSSRTAPWKTIGYALASIPRPGPGTNPQLWVEGDQVYSPATNGESFPIRAAYQIWVEGTLPRGNRPVLAPPGGTTAVVFDPAEFYQRNDVTWRYLRFSGGDYGMTIGANPSQKHAPRVQDCEFVAQTKAGVRIDGLSTGTNDPRFFQNRFEGAINGIEIHVPGTNPVVYPDIEENTFTGITGDAILLDDTSPSGGNVGARIASCWFVDGSTGVRLTMSSHGKVPTLDIATCNFRDLTAGGVRCEVSNASGVSATVRKSSFLNCSPGFSVGGSLDGGASTVELSGNTFRDCAPGHRTSMSGTGTLAFRSQDDTLEECTVGSTIQDPGNGITVRGSIHRNRYLRNAVGIAIASVATGTTSITSTLLARNTVGVAMPNAMPTVLRHATIAGGSLGIVCGLQTGHLTIDHVVLTDVVTPVRGNPTIRYSCFKNTSWPGTGNLNNTDPQLVLPFYKLAPTSPCIDAGDPQTTLPDTDYEGDPRASVSKLGGQALPDIGADEYVFRGSARKYGTPGFGYFNFFPEISAGSPNASLGTTLDVRLSGALLPVFHIPATSALLTLGTRDDAGNLPFDLAPFGAPGSFLWNDVSLVLGPYAVAQDGTASAQLPIPNLASLRGLNLAFQWFATLPQANAAGFATSDGLRVTIGESTTQLVEEFDNDAFLDADNSSARWGAGVLRGGQIGGTGVDGEFSLNTPGIEDLGNGTWLFRTTPEVVGGQTRFVEIPAERSYKNVPRQVADGRLEFSKFVVPAGQTIVFRGALPPRISVRGNGEVLGRLSLDGTSSTSNWDGVSITTGRPGFPGGCFGGAGGKGGDKGDGLGHSAAFDGQPGEDVRLLAGHAYSARAIGTGGRGSVQYPLDGLLASITNEGIVGSVSDQLSAAGGGGGFDGAGELGKAFYTMGNKLTNLGPDAAGGLRFDNFPLPPNTATADHFLVGGSGGGGAGSCPFFSSRIGKRYKSGGAGMGGGGALALRTGYALTIGPGAAISARGGSGYQSLNNFNSVPEGGGGSGGSVVLQTSGTVAQNGTLSVRGGLGAQALVTQTSFELKVKGGDGAPGLIRLETPAPAVAQLGTCEPPATTRDVGTLTETDTKVGAQSRWYRTDAATPLFVRYRIDALVNAAPASFSDDPALGLPLAQEGEAVEFYVQGANLDAQGNPIPGQVSEWLRYVGRFPGNQGRSLQEAGYSSFRWQMVLNRTNGRDVAVERVTVVWQG